MPAKQGRGRDKRKPRQETRFMNPSTAPHLSAASPCNLVGVSLTPASGGATHVGPWIVKATSWILPHQPFQHAIAQLGPMA